MTKADQRSRILSFINQLEPKLCDRCKIKSLAREQLHCPCPASVRIREYSRELAQIAIDTKKDLTDAMLRDVKRNGMTLKLYKDLKLYRIPSIDMEEAMGINRKQFNRWKADNGLIMRAY